MISPQTTNCDDDNVERNIHNNVLRVKRNGNFLNARADDVLFPDFFASAWSKEIAYPVGEDNIRPLSPNSGNIEAQGSTGE